MTADFKVCSYTSQAIPKFLTFVVRAHELRTLRSIVQLGTGATTLAAAGAAERRLLRQYTRRALATTAVIASSFVLAYLLVIVGTYAFSLATADLWLNPLKVQIPGVRCVRVCCGCRRDRCS